MWPAQAHHGASAVACCAPTTLCAASLRTRLQHHHLPPPLQNQQHQQHQQQQRCRASNSEAAAPEQQRLQLTCRRCLQRFSSEANTRSSCSFHPALYTGGEVAKAIGFVRASSNPEDQLGAVVGRTGLMRFWDCCGAASEAAPGCVQGYHLTFDDELNEARGWRE